MDDILIDRERELRIISVLTSQRKNIIIFGEEGVGKTAIINKVLADQFNAKKYLYMEESKTFREALMGLVLSGSNSRVKIEEKNILELRKMVYPLLDKQPEYIIFDHIGRIEPKYYSFLEYLIERNLPLMVISQGTDKKAIGNLRYLLHNFERVEISNFSRVATDVLVVHYINAFNIKIIEPDNFKKAIFHFSNGNPKIVKQICSLARDTKYQKKGFIDVKLINLDRRINYTQG
jgi:GTPase SAR1 family protein